MSGNSNKGQKKNKAAAPSEVVIVAPSQPSKPKPRTKTKPKAARAPGGLQRSHMGGFGDYFEDVGSWLGKKAGGFIGKLFGTGDYTSGAGIHMSDTPDGNALLEGTQIPSMNGSPNDPVRVPHKEYIGPVYSSQAFTSTVIPFSPGLPNYPWLSRQANAYAEWCPKGAILMYVPKVSPNNNTASGNVTLASNYNVTLPAFTSMEQASNQMFSAPGRPMDGLMMAVECAPKERLFQNLQVVADLSGASGDDRRASVLCNFNICVEGCPTTGDQIGSLWLTSLIEFTKPTTTSTTAVARQGFYTAATASVVQTNTAGPFTNQTMVLQGPTAWPVTFAPTTATLSLPGGTYLVECSRTSTTPYFQATSTPTNVTATGATINWYTPESGATSQFQSNLSWMLQMTVAQTTVVTLTYVMLTCTSGAAAIDTTRFFITPLALYSAPAPPLRDPLLARLQADEEFKVAVISTLKAMANDKMASLTDPDTDDDYSSVVSVSTRPPANRGKLMGPVRRD
jgi:hypothetical protein